MNKMEMTSRPSPSTSLLPRTEAELTHSSIYLSNLPPTFTLPDLIQLCSKYGVLATDANHVPKAKLYYASDGVTFKGDALVTYYKPASVLLAVQFLNDEIIDQHPIHVAPAQFSSATLHPSRTSSSSSGSGKKTKASFPNPMKRKKGTMKGGGGVVDVLERKLGWTGTEDVRPIGPKPVPPKYLKSVVLKHMFTLPELQKDPGCSLDIKEEIREECSKLGVVTNVVLYDVRQCRKMDSL
ncbi:hypothetical protein HMI54_011261 [Coelomomyces lativittatus]|nr:hypothetical protein HMI54_011261 [Coelomomyces lativittatus]